MAFDEKADDGWCQHLHYDALIADPVETVRRLYAGFGEEVGLAPRPAHARLPRGSAAGRSSAATATTRPTSAGPTPAWPTEFKDYTERYHIETANHS